jgi:hypothetical protein
MARALYSVLAVTDEKVIIEDIGGRVSVTNDAETVVEELLAVHGARRTDGELRRILYYDSMRNLDELVHNGIRFTGFAPVQIRDRSE